MNESGIRAEEIIADLWRQIRGFHEQGVRPDMIILSPAVYRRIQAYRTGLGDLADPEKDYLSRHEVFGLPIFIDPGIPWAVRAAGADQEK
jgi:hypothetical protein